MYRIVVVFCGSLLLGACSLLGQGPQAETESVASTQELQLSERERFQADQLFFEGLKEKHLDNDSKAISLLQESLKIDTENHAAKHELSKLYLKRGQLDQAVFQAKAACRMQPDNKWYLLQLAEILNAQGQYAQEAGVYEELVALEPQNPEWYFNLANAYIQSQDWKGALKAYDALEEQAGLQEDISFQKQKLYLQLGQFDNAVNEIQALIDSRPTEARYYGMMAELYMMNENPSQALSYIDRLLEKDPGNGLGQLSKAMYLQELGRFDESYQYLKFAMQNPEVKEAKKAEILMSFYDLSANSMERKTQAYELCRAVLDLHPKNPRFHEIYGKLNYRDHKNEKAYKALREACRLNPAAWGNWALCLEIAALQSWNDTLEADAESALKLFPDQGLAYYFLGYAKFINAKYAEAVSVLDKGRFFVPDPGIKAEMQFFLGLSHLELEHFDKAYEAYERALKLNPNYAGVLNSYAYSLALRKMRLEKAKAMSSKSLELEPNNAAFLDTYAWVLYQLGDYAQALEYIDRALDLSSEQPSGELFEHKGDILFRLGEIEEAKNFWLRASELRGTSDQLKDKINTGKLND